MVISKKTKKNKFLGLKKNSTISKFTYFSSLCTNYNFDVTLSYFHIVYKKVERLKPTNEGDVINQGAPLRVKFSNVREKIKVLQASRNASQTLKDERISIIEDFTDKVRENTHLQGSSSQRGR